MQHLVCAIFIFQTRSNARQKSDPDRPGMIHTLFQIHHSHDTESQDLQFPER